MNRHPGPFSHPILCGILLIGVTAVSDLRGQTTAPAPAGAAPSAVVATNVPILAGSNPAQAAAARDAIIEAASRDAAGVAAALDTGIAPALQNSSELVRMNAAIVVARVAERGGGAALQGSTLTILGDKSRFVSLWGVKAARFVLPAVMRTPTANPNNLLTAVVAAVGSHGTGPIGGAIAAEAYEALTIDAFSTDPKNRPSPASLGKVIPFVHQLLQQRVALYQKGIPPEPLADQRGTLFLVDNRVWTQQNAAQKVTSLQLMSDLIGLAAQHVAAAGQVDHANLALAIRYVGLAIAVVPETQPIAAQLKPVAAISEQTPAPQIVAAVAAVQPALITIPAFAKITPPPTAAAPAAPDAAPANGAAGATQPTTAPTTAPAASTVPSTAAAIPPNPTAAAALTP
jgi:hypothetical protein